MRAQVTTVPREKYPLGQTVTTPNEQRERTRMFTRRYLEEQLLTVLAGAARRPARPRRLLAGECGRASHTTPRSAQASRPRGQGCLLRIPGGSVRSVLVRRVRLAGRVTLPYP